MKFLRVLIVPLLAVVLVFTATRGVFLPVTTAQRTFGSFEKTG